MVCAFATILKHEIQLSTALVGKISHQLMLSTVQGGGLYRHVEQ